MDEPCQKCLRDPTGFAGHGDLRVQRVGDCRMTLQCRRCGSLWSRTLEREGYFAWAPVTPRMAAAPKMGIPVPPLAVYWGGEMPWRGGDGLLSRTSTA